MDRDVVLPPRGAITEIVGNLSSGRTSLLVCWLATITRGGGTAAVVDTDDTFDPAAASRAGVDLRRLLWVRGDGRRLLAVRAADALVRRPGFALIALDTGETPPTFTLETAFRLKLAARRAETAFVLLAPRRLAGAAAALAVETVQEGIEWGGPTARPTRLHAVRTRLHVLRSPDARSAGAGGGRALRWTA